MIKQMWKKLVNQGEGYMGVHCTILATHHRFEIFSK